MLSDEDIHDLPGSARDAISAAQKRIWRAVDADDVEGVVGASKELIETVCKVVIDLRGGIYGSAVDLPKLARQTLGALNRDPDTLQGRPALRQLGLTFVTATHAIAELRNSDGTGHGRSKRSDLDPTHGRFIREAAGVWCQWLLATARHDRRTGLDDFIEDISGPLVLHAGDLPQLLQDLSLAELDEDDQRRVGLAVARRWSVNDTFLPLKDVINPIAMGDIDYPPAFCEGAVEGLLLDQNGGIRIASGNNVRTAVGVGLNLPGARRQRFFQELADRLEDAGPSYKFKAEQREGAAQAWRELAGQQHDFAVQDALERIATRFEKLRRGSSTDVT